jgi:hypothetical protein
MKTRRTAVLSLIVFSVCCAFSNAQSVAVPRLVNFAGKAIEAQGKVVSGTAGVTLAINGLYVRLAGIPVTGT